MKHVLSRLGAFMLVSVFIVPLSIQAQTTNPVTITPTVIPMKASFVSVATPTLKLTYNSARKESSLVATFDITINGGASGRSIYDSFSETLTGSAYSVMGMGTTNQKVTVTSDITRSFDNYGRTIYSIPANQTITFHVVKTYNPQLLFAGQYTVSLNYLYINEPGGETQYTVPSNTSNKVTIVGEIAPYISNVSVSNNTVTLTGVRFAKFQNEISVDGKVVVAKTPSKANAGKIISFNYNSAKIVPGSHTLSIKHPDTGKSNDVTLQIPGGVVPPTIPGCATGAVYNSLTGVPCNPQNPPVACSPYMYTRDLTIGSRGDDVLSVQKMLASKGFLTIVPDGNFGTSTRQALASWQASVGISPADGNFGVITRAYLQTVDPCIPPTISTTASAVVSNPNMTLKYSDQNKESQLIATFKVAISSGAQPVKIYKNGATIQALSEGAKTHFVQYGGSLEAVTPAVYDGNMFNIPANTTVQFTATAYFSPQAMFAGSYKARVLDIVTDSVRIPVTSLETNAVTIVGETMPSITIISPNGGETFAQGSSMPIRWTTTNVASSSQIMTVRLRNTDNQQEYNLLSNTANDGTETVVLPYSIPNGSYKLELKSAVGDISFVDASDNAFTISPITPPVSAKITLSVSPSTTITSSSYGNINMTSSVPVASWEMRIECTSGVSVSMKGGGACGEATRVVNSATPYSYTWPVWFVNKSDIARASTIYVRAFDSSNRVIGETNQKVVVTAK